MSAQIPVTNSTIVTDSGSTSRAAFTCSPPTGIQLNRVWVTSRPGTGVRPRSPA